MSQLAGVVRLLKTEHDRLNRQIRGISSALSAFGRSLRKADGQTVEDVGCRPEHVSQRLNV
jgi:hypothetical protein